MEIELSNGQLKFWQWDTGQKVKVPENVPTVHFKYGASAVELPVSDRWVDVPDELLQTGKDILLWTYDEDHTLDAARIPVEKRQKPSDYVYTPTEIKTWETLNKRIKALEDGGGIAGVSSVNGQTGAVTITAEGLGALTEDDLQSATNAALAQAKASGEFDGAQGPKGDTGTAGPTGPAGAGLDVTGATVGQTVKISAVDDNGVPTAWVPVDMASDEKWEKIAEIVIPDGAAETNALTINKDINGEQFSLIKARLCIKQPKYTGESNIPGFSFAMINGKIAGRITPLVYTNAFRMPSKTIITGSVYEVDVSGAQQIETVYRARTNGGWSEDATRDYITYSGFQDEYSRYVADTLWARPITSIGGTSMLIYPGCRYVLYGVRA